MNSPISSTSSAAHQQILVFPPGRGIGVLSVSPPFPVNFKPQADGALGININMVYGDRKGLLVYILAYLNMVVGDSLRVFIDTDRVPVAELSVTDAHFDDQGLAKNIPFYISAQNMEARFAPLKNENKLLWFVVQRVSGNPAESSPRAPLFYKYPAPGEADTDGGKPFNQGLKLPVASETVVDQSVIAEGMTVTVAQYFNQSIGDVVVLAFGSLLFEIIVTALGDVIFELTPQQLASLAPTNSLVVRWEVFDRVENASGWSDSLNLAFKPGVALLNAPIFDQADIDNVIDHNALAGRPLDILVTGVFAKDDVIELTLEGLTRGGDPVTELKSQTLAVTSRSVKFTLDNEHVRNLIGGALHAHYQLIRTGKPQQSKPADATISGTSQLLGLPILEPLVDGKLPVDTAQATVRVAAYWPLKKGATVELRWQTTDRQGIVALFVFRQIVTDTTLPITFHVDANYIAPYANTPLTLQNTIANPGEVQVQSELLQSKIGEETKIELLPPLLLPPAVSPIDVLAYVNGLTLRIEYLLALAGDEAQLVEINPPAGSAPFPLVKFGGSKRIDTVLTAAFLAARHGRDLELTWRLNRNNAVIGTSSGLNLTVLRIKDNDSRLPMPKVIQAPDNLNFNLGNFTGDAGIRLAPLPGAHLGQRVWLKCSGILESGASHTITLLTSHLLTATEVANGFTNITLPRSQLTLLKNDSLFSVDASVAFNGEADLLKSTHLPTLKLNFKKPNLVSGSENFETVPVQTFRQNIPVKLNSGLTVRVLADSPGSTYNVQTLQTNGQYTPRFGNRTLLADHGAIFRLEFNGEARNASIELSVVNKIGTTVFFCNKNNSNLQITAIPITVHPNVHIVSYTAQPGKEASYILIQVGPEADGGIWVDNIVFWN